MEDLTQYRKVSYLKYNEIPKKYIFSFIINNIYDCYALMMSMFISTTKLNDMFKF